MKLKGKADLSKPASQRLPLTVLTGFLGAGKTTLLNRFLKSDAGSGTAVLVNEFGDVDVDGAIIGASLGSNRMVNLPNGCVCCEVQDDLAEALIELCDRPTMDDSKFDGRSLAPLLKDPNSEWPERTIITDSQRVKDPVKWRKSSTMTDRWRLVNGKQLFDIKADPSQKKNVAAENTDVVERLTADYDAWWEDISPVFTRDSRIIVGNQAENPSHLTSHDWLTSERIVPWNQEQVRAGKPGTGAWALKVESAGKYRITLRRWPLPVEAPMSGGLPAGDAVPGLKAYRETVGKPLPIVKAGVQFAGKKLVKDVPANATKIEFEVDLDAGDVDLAGFFKLEDDTKINSYYASVERL